MAHSLRTTRAIAELGYVHLLPLVANYVRMYLEAIDSSSPAYSGGFGRWAHHRRAVSHRSDVVTSEATTLVSTMWIDVRAEPWVVDTTTPADGRATLVTDLWGFLVDGSDDPRSAGGPVAIAGEGWHGNIPTGVAAVLPAESTVVRCERWVRFTEDVTPGSADAIQSSYRAGPLSTWAGRSPVPAPDTDWWPVDMDTLTTMRFWPTASFALGLTTPHDDDRGVLERLAEIGVRAGVPWDDARFPDRLLDAIGEGMDEAISELLRAARDDAQPPRTRAAGDRDHFGRAANVLRTLPLDDSSRAFGSRG